MPRLTLALLGGLRTQLDSGESLTLPTRKAQALVAYLAVPAGQPHSRDALASLLWGGRNEESARNSLRQALFGIRRALAVTGQPTLVLGRTAVALNSAAVDVDVAAFERDAAEGTRTGLERAVALYRGDLLAELALQEAPFDEWLSTERERLRELVLQCLGKLFSSYCLDGATELAIQTGLRLLAIDPLQEIVYRTLMSLYVKSNRLGSALRQYQLCVSVLQRELGVEPDADTKALYQQILRAPLRRHADQAIRVAAPLAQETVLVGRDAEVARLGDALAEAVAGRGQMVAVLGEAGIGKTRLMAELSAEAGRRGGSVLVGRAYESEQILPFGPWGDALRGARLDENAAVLEALTPARRGQLARLLPELDAKHEPAAGPSDFRLVFESVLDLVRALAAHQPVVVILEDLHWADQLTLRLAAFLGRRVHAWPILLVVTARDEDLGDAPQLIRTLDELDREPHFRRLGLAPLTRADTQALVRALSPAGTEVGFEDLADHVWTISEGNPFVATEAMRAGDRGDSAAALTLPERVREMVQRRLERLGEASQHVVATAAVIGRDFEFALLQRASRLDATEAAERVEELVRRRVFHGVDERLDFVHARIRETAEARLLPHRRAMLHRAVADAIEDLYMGALEPHDVALGTHYRHAGVWERAMLYSGRAGLRALSDGAHHEAAVLLRYTLEALDHLPAAPYTVPLRADLLLALAQARYHLGDLEHALSSLRSLDSIGAAGDRHRLKRCLEGIAFGLASLGQLADAREAIERAAASTAEPGDASPGYSFQAARVYYALGDYRRAVEAARFEIEVFGGERKHARRWRVPLAAAERFWLILSLAELGEFPEALRVADEALALAEATGYPMELIFACLPAGRMHLVRGDVAAAIATLERARPLCRQGGDFFVYLSRIATSLGLAYALSGHADDGLALLREAVDVDETLQFVYHLPLSLLGLAEGHLLAGETAVAERYAARGLETARTHGHRGWEAWTLRLLGDLARRQGDTAGAARSYREALSLAGSLGMRPLLAHCHRGLSTVSGKDRAEARQHAATATALYRELGMTAWLALNPPA